MRFEFLTSVIARILWSAPGRPHSQLSAARSRKNRRRAGRQGSDKDPRASTPRAIEACRSPVPAALEATSKSQVRQSLWRPARGVFRFAPQRPRWTSHFRQPASPCGLSGCLSTAVGRDQCRRAVTAAGIRRHRARRRMAGALGPLRLGPPGRVGASPPPRHSPDTAPRFVSEDADQTPLGIETGCAKDKGAGASRG